MDQRRAKREAAQSRILKSCGGVANVTRDWKCKTQPKATKPAHLGGRILSPAAKGAVDGGISGLISGTSKALIEGTISSGGSAAVAAGTRAVGRVAIPVTVAIDIRDNGVVKGSAKSAISIGMGWGAGIAVCGATGGVGCAVIAGAGAGLVTGWAIDKIFN